MANGFAIIYPGSKNEDADQTARISRLVYALVFGIQQSQGFSRRYRGVRGSVVECLIRDRGVAGSSLTGGNGLRH